VPSYIDLLSQEMGFSYELVPHTYDPLGSFWDGLSADTCDVVLAGISNAASHDATVGEFFALSQPIFSSTNRVLVLKTTKEMDLWRLFEPFTPGLWFAVVCNVFFVAMTIHLLEVLSHGRLKDAITPESIAQSSYHAWAAFLGGEDYEWVSWPGRCLRLGLLFLILIVISTYTANLAAFFTRPVYEIHGPTDLDTLKGAVACTIWSNDVAALEGFVSEVISPNHTWPHADRRQWCHDALKEGRAQAWFDDYAAHNSYQLKHCSALALVPAISLKPLVVGFAMSAANVSLVSSMSAALVHLEKQPAIRNLEQDLFGWGRVCPSDSELVSSTTPVSFQSLGGAFLISGALMLMSLVMAIATFALRSYQGAKYVAPDSATDGEMLRELLTKVAELERLYAGAEGTEPLPPSLQDDLSLSVMEVASVPVCPAPSSPQQSKERTPWTEGASER